MNTNEVLKKIRKCNMNKPFIFISYSSKDSAVVWRDVLEFQNRGYNVWLDEINLDKRNDTWKTDAKGAIEDKDCKLVVFYVSRNSLTSRPCYEEMLTTKSRTTQAMHRGNEVKYIAVDVEPINNIMDFKQDISNEILDGELSKDEQKKIVTLIDEFISDFFNSNNDRVRIKHKKEQNRARDYYDDIINCLPREALIYEPVITTEENIVEELIFDFGDEDADLIEEEYIYINKESSNVTEEQSDIIKECDLFFQGAKAIQNEKGITVLKGSLISTKTADSCPEKAKKLREEAIQSGELVVMGNDYQLTVDKFFKTTSGAATFVSGYSISGSVAWKSKTSTYTPKESKSDIKEMIQDGQIAINAKVYVKGNQSDIGTVTENGYILYKGQNVTLNQYVLLVLGPGSRNAYQYVCEMNSGKTLSDLRNGKEDIEIEEKKKDPVKAQSVSFTLESVCDDSITIGDIRKKFEDNLVAFSFRNIREGMPRGGKGAMDYAMAAILSGCNEVKKDSPVYQINYYSYVVSDPDNKKEGAGLGATWTWSSNCRKVLGLEKSGQIPSEINEFFENLSETTTLREIEQAFINNQIEAYQTKKNELVVEAIQRIYTFLKDN